MRRSQAGMLALVASAAVGVVVLVLALLTPATSGDPVDVPTGPAAASALEHSLREADAVERRDAASIAREPASSAARASAVRASAESASPDPASGRITGRVLGGRSSREPLAGARVRLRLGLSEPIQSAEATTDESGRFACDGLRLGGWFVEAVAHEHQKVSELARLRPESTAVEVDLSLPISRELDVRVVDERGQPLTFARLGLPREFAGAVRVTSLRAKHVGPALVPGSTLRSREIHGEGGHGEELTWKFRRALLAEARVVLCVGERVAAVALVPTFGDELRLVIEESTIPLLTRDLDFVVTASGTPVAEAQVKLSPYQTGTLTRSTDDQGRVRIEGVPHASLELRVVAAGRPQHSSWIDADRVESTLIDLPESRRVEGLVLSDRAAPDASVRIGVWRIHDPEKRVRNLTSSVWSTRAAAFAFADLEPGIYVLAGVGSKSPRGTAADVRRGEIPGAVWLDLRAGDALGVVLEIGAGRELDRLPPGKWPDDPPPSGAGGMRKRKPSR